MKRILMIATGGTIASKPTGSGLAPLITSDELLQFVPDIARFCQPDAVSLMNLDSTNMTPDDWLSIARCIEERADRYDGFVVTHGTDTMAYTACALNYLIQNFDKPVVLTGSQKSIANRDTDARLNLLNAFAYAADSGSRGIAIVFDGRAIRASRARKMYTKSWNAFTSIDYPDLAKIRDGRILRFISEPPAALPPAFSHALNSRVFAFKLIPGVDANVLYRLMPDYDALVIESFGVGGVPLYGSEKFLSAIDAWSREGKTVAMTTQVPHEGSDMSVYQVGFDAKERFDILESYTMTFESVVTKLMWILAGTRDPKKIRALFYTPIGEDLLAYQ